MWAPLVSMQISTMAITGMKLGKHTVVAGLTSDQIEHVSGSVEVNVYLVYIYVHWL